MIGEIVVSGIDEKLIVVWLCKNKIPNKKQKRRSQIQDNDFINVYL